LFIVGSRSAQFDERPTRRESHAAAQETRTRTSRPSVALDPDTIGPRGIPRKLDEPRIREQLRTGRLSTNEAAFWE
jgi:serine/threonine protein kinase HipA of HipAB toxin-antitoxin module